MGWPRHRSLVVGVVVVAVAIPVVLGMMLASPAGQTWSDAVLGAVREVEWLPRWLLRGGLRWLATPFVVVVVAWTFVRMLRAGRRRAATIAFAVSVGSFLASEAIKLGLLPFPAFGSDATHDLSGHVAMVAAALVVVVVAAPPRSRPKVLASAWLLILGTGIGVVVAGWHDGGEVVVPMAIAIAWTVAGSAVTGWAVASRRGAPAREAGRWRWWQLAPWALTLGCAAAVTGLVIGAGGSTGPLAPLLAVALAAAAGSTALAQAAHALAAALDDPVPAGRAS